MSDDTEEKTRTFDCLNCGRTIWANQCGPCGGCEKETLRERDAVKPEYWLKDFCDCETPCTCLRAAWVAEVETRGAPFWDEHWLAALAQSLEIDPAAQMALIEESL